MAKKQHKEQIQQPKESQTTSTLIKLFFLISFIVLGFFVFNDMPINWILGIYAVDILVSLIYVVINKGRIATSNVVHTNVRRILAFLIMLITMFFYAFASWPAPVPLMPFSESPIPIIMRILMHRDIKNGRK